MKLRSLKTIMNCLNYRHWKERKKRKKRKKEEYEGDRTKNFGNDMAGKNSVKQSIDDINTAPCDICCKYLEKTNTVTIEEHIQYAIEETETNMYNKVIIPSGSENSYLCLYSRQASATSEYTDEEELGSQRIKKSCFVTDSPIMITDDIMSSLDVRKTVNNSLTKGKSDKSHGKQDIEKSTGDANVRGSMCGKLDAENNSMNNSLLYSSLMDDTVDDQIGNLTIDGIGFIQESEHCLHTEQSLNLLKPEAPGWFSREGRVFSQGNEISIQSLDLLKPEPQDTNEIKLPEPDNKFLQTKLKTVVNNDVKPDSEGEASSNTIPSLSESSDDIPSGYPRSSCNGSNSENSFLSSQVLTNSVSVDSPVFNADAILTGYPRFSCDGSSLEKSSVSSQVLSNSVSFFYHTVPSVQTMDYIFEEDSFRFEISGKFVMIEHTEKDSGFEDFVFVSKIEDVLLTGIKASLDHLHDRKDKIDGQKDFEEEPFVTKTHEHNMAIKTQTNHAFGQTNIIDNSGSSFDVMQNMEDAEFFVRSFSDNEIKSNDCHSITNTLHGIDTEGNVIPASVANLINMNEQSDKEFFNVHDSCDLAENLQKPCTEYDVQHEAENCDSLLTVNSERKLENEGAKHTDDNFREIKPDLIQEDKHLSVVPKEDFTMEDAFLGKHYSALIMQNEKLIVITGLPFSVASSPFEKFIHLNCLHIGIVKQMNIVNESFTHFLLEKLHRGNQMKIGGNSPFDSTNTVGQTKINFEHWYIYLEPVLHVSELNDLDIGEQICLEKELKQQQKKSGKVRKKPRKKNKKKKTSQQSAVLQLSVMGNSLSSSDSSVREKKLLRHQKLSKNCRKCHKKCPHCLCTSSLIQPRTETEENVFDAPVNQQSFDSGLGTFYSFHSSLESIAKQKLVSMKKAKSSKTLKEVESIKCSLLSLEERIKGMAQDLSHFRPVNVDVTLYPGLNSYFERFPSGTTPTLSQQMQFEWLRVSSFGTYTGQGSCINLARNGFHADPSVGPEATRCCKCGVVVSDWEYFDNVADRHRQLSPNCPFVTGRDAEEGNVSIFDEGSANTSTSQEPQVNTGTSEGASASLSGHLANAEFTSVASTRSATQASSSSSSGASSSESTESYGNKSTSVPGDSKEVEPYQPVEDAENQSLPRLGGRKRDKPAQAAPSSRPPGNNVPGTSGAVGAGAFASQGGGGGARTGSQLLLDEIISTLDNQLGGEWMLVALNLGMTQVDIERVQELEPHSTLRQIRSAFSQWRNSSAYTDMGKIESLIQALEESGRNDLADVLKDRRDAIRRSESNPGSSGSPMPQDGVGNPEFVIVENPKHPNYSSLAARISSFRGWPSTLGQSSRQMAAAGFYYAGVADFTRCFCCGGGLRNWETGDDPILEHTRWFPTCEYVIRLKGRTYVNRISRRQQEHLAQQKRQAEEQERRRAALQNAPDPLESAAAQTLLEMGYPAERVRTAITELRRASGNVTVSADQAVRYLLDEEERQLVSGDIPPAVTGGGVIQSSSLSAASNTARAGSPVGPQSLRAGGGSATGSQGASAAESQSPAGSLTSNVSTTAVAGSLTGKLQGNSASATVLEGKDTSGGKRDTKSGKKKKKKSRAQTQGSKLSGEVHGEIDAQSLRVENERLREMHKCKICMERMVDTTILPCGHLVCCGECASRVNQCPICRVQIKGTVKTFLS